MALPSTGSLSMSQVNTELGRNSTQTISLGEAAVRDLAQRPTGSISFQDLRGKSALAPRPSVEFLQPFFLNPNENTKDVPLTRYFTESNITIETFDYIILWTRTTIPLTPSTAMPNEPVTIDLRTPSPSIPIPVVNWDNAPNLDRLRYTTLTGTTRMRVFVLQSLADPITNLTVRITRASNLQSDAVVNCIPVLVKSRIDGNPSILEHIVSNRSFVSLNATSITTSSKVAPANSVSFMYLGRNATESPRIVSPPPLSVSPTFNFAGSSFGNLRNISHMWFRLNSNQIAISEGLISSLVTPNEGANTVLHTIRYA